MYYERGTSPRKYNTECTPRPKNRTKVQPNKQTKKAVKKQTPLQRYGSIILGIILVFAFLVSFRSSKIEERNVQIQAEKKLIEQLKNENAQLNMDLQKTLSLTNIEKQAKEKLGMQKLQNNQIRYVKLDKQDYVEPVSITRIETKQESFIQKIINFLFNK